MSSDRIKELRIWAKENLQQKSIYHKEFGRDICFTGTGIKEYLNQPHKYFYEKNELIRDMENILQRSIYKGGTPYHKNDSNIVTSHIFEVEIQNEKSWIIVREGKNGNINFYSISDSEKVLKDIKKQVAESA